MLRHTLNDTQRRQNKDGWEVLITTYNLASGDEKDRKFFRKMEWDVRASFCEKLCRCSFRIMAVLRVR